MVEYYGKSGEHNFRQLFGWGGHQLILPYEAIPHFAKLVTRKMYCNIQLLVSYFPTYTFHLQLSTYS